MNNESLTLDIYVNYPGCCEEAFSFYAANLGGNITLMLPHHEAPPNFPKDWPRPIMHAVMDIGGTLLRGADIPGAEPMRSAYLTLRLPDANEAERIYTLLSSNGEVFMPMEKTFFANRFAMLRDRFGTAWMLMQGMQ